MTRCIFVACLALGALFSLAGCATEDDPFPTHPAAKAESDVPVAGAATPPPGSASGGWKW